MAVLSENQRKVYEYLQTRSGSIPPTVREICLAVGISSTSTVHGILKALEEKGCICRDALHSRSIQLEGSRPSVQVPILGRVTCGQPILAVEEVEDYIPVSADLSRGRQLFALHAVGDSMMNAGILDGDLLICERVPTADDGSIVVALLEDEATVKRLYREKCGVRLQPENPAYHPIYAANVLILGKVIATMRLYE